MTISICYKVKTHLKIRRNYYKINGKKGRFDIRNIRAFAVRKREFSKRKAKEAHSLSIDTTNNNNICIRAVDSHAL